MVEMIQLACVCSMSNKTKKEIEVLEMNSPSGKYIKRTFYQGIGFMDYSTKNLTRKRIRNQNPLLQKLKNN